MTGPLIFLGLVVIFAGFLWWLGRGVRAANNSLKDDE